MTRTRRASTRWGSALLVAVALATGACSGTSDDSIPPTTAPTSTAPAPSSTAATTTSTTSATTTTTTGPVAAPEDVLAGWEAFWEEWARQRASDPIDRAALEDVASSAVVDGVVEFFERERESGAPLLIPRVFPSGSVTAIQDDTASLSACTLISRPPTGVPGTLYDVSMVKASDERWVVGELAVASAAGCVPTELAEAAVEAYEGYWDDRALLSNPADPDAPWLEERTTGEHLNVMTALYTDWQERGLYFEGRPETHPEIVEVLPDWAVVILDCMVVPPEWGVYDIESGERTDDAEPVGEEGRIDLRSAQMSNDEADATGTWRVETLAGEVDASCEFAPTANALPQS